MAAKSSRQEILQFLDDLDHLSPEASASSASAKKAKAPAAEDAQSALDFLDGLTKRSSTPVPPAANPPRSSSEITRSTSKASLRPQTPNSPARAGSPLLKPATPTPEAPAAVQPEQPQSWGWSSVWNSASSVLQQAREVADHNLSPNVLQSQQEHAKKWTGAVLGSLVQGVGQLDLEQVKNKGLKAMTEILNAVAPPIAEHEVIQVWLSHDMLGYEGVETLVYRAFAKVLEQVEGGELHVNKGATNQPASAGVADDDRNLNAAESYEQGYKLAQAEVDALLQQHPPEAATSTTSTSDLPITLCPVYLRIQPIIAGLPSVPGSDQHLSFLFLFFDPSNKLQHQTLTQGLPASWLDIPFEENEWVENEMVDVIRKGVEVISQDYVRTRQHGRAQAAAQARAALLGSAGQPEPSVASPRAAEGPSSGA